MDIQAYFDRIGYTGSAEPTAENLAKILRLHLETVPFENLDSYPNGKAMTNDMKALYEKVVVRRRGGVCFELNTLFYGLLKAMGYETYPIEVRLHMRPDFPAPYTHGGVVAVIDGVKYYCDVGFGGPGPKGLVPLNTEEEQIFDGMRYRVRVEGIYVKIEWFHDDEWHLQISYADIPCIPEDFQARLYFFTTAPDSHFVVQRIVNLCLPCGGSLALTGNQFTARRNGEVTQVVLETEEEVTRVLKEEFGIVL